MKSLLTAFAAAALLGVGLASCGDDEEELKYAYVDFMANGIQLRDTINNACKVGTVPAEGKTLTFVAKGENQQYGSYYGTWVSSQSTSLTNFYPSRFNAEATFPFTACEEDWGKVVITSANPYTAQVVVNPNTTGESREILLEFGDGQNYQTFFYLNQAAQ